MMDFVRVAAVVLAVPAAFGRPAMTPAISDGAVPVEVPAEGVDESASTAGPEIPEGASLDEAIAIVRAAGLGGEALESAVAGLFDEAEETGDALAHARLSAGLMLAEAGLLEGAADQFREADSAARSARFRASARSNLGHLLYRTAMESMAPKADPGGPAGGGGAPDFDGAIATLRRSADAFRSVLDLDSSNSEAARNAERVRRAIDRIEQIRRQAREQAEQMRQQADKLDDLADRQQQESMENDQQAQPSDEAQQDQSSLSEETARQSEQMQQQPGGEGAKEQVERAQQSQQEAQEALEEGDQQGASDAQREAAEQLREAARQLREQADETDGQQGQPQEGDPGEPSEQDGEQKGEPQPGEEQEGESEEDRIAQWLLDREQRQREQRDQQQRAVRGRGVPVEKDW